MALIEKNPELNHHQGFTMLYHWLLSGGKTVVVPATQIDVTQENKRMFLFDPGTTLNDIVRAINQVGAAPGDLIAILEALKEAGALQANLVVI